MYLKNQRFSFGVEKEEPVNWVILSPGAGRLRRGSTGNAQPAASRWERAPSPGNAAPLYFPCPYQCRLNRRKLRCHMPSFPTAFLKCEERDNCERWHFHSRYRNICFS